jgi:hypothetical protein
MSDLAPGAAPDAAAASFDHFKAATLDIRLTDALSALVTAAASLGVLGYGMSAGASFLLFLLLHLLSLAVPVWMLLRCLRRNGDLTIPALLVIATAATGPIGALGCALMALLLWVRRPTPWRLQHWYDYISGVVERGRVTDLYDELVSGRLPPDQAATVPRFNPILHDTSLEDQQRVLGVIGRRYHPDFRPTLRKAMRHKNGFIRAQAAAIASRLSPDEKARLWTTAEPQPIAPEADASALDVEPPRP